jgi:hypothetical protein
MGGMFGWEVADHGSDMLICYERHHSSTCIGKRWNYSDDLLLGLMFVGDCTELSWACFFYLPKPAQHVSSRKLPR